MSFNPLFKESAYQEYFKLLKELFARAQNVSPLEFLFTLLEVDGMSHGHWNTTNEVTYLFDDMSELLSESFDDKKNKFRKYRLALLIYCHLVEMNFGHKLIANTLQIINKGFYKVDPFSHKWQKKKFGYIPPSISAKLGVVKNLAKDIDHDFGTTYMDGIFNDEVRNAFSHADYCLTTGKFRYFSNGIAKEIKLTEVDQILENCFAFYKALFDVYVLNKALYAGFPRYYKMKSAYEVLELLVADQQVYGFNMHFSNGQKATFTRKDELVEAINIVFNSKQIDFFIGDIGELTTQYMVDGRPFI